MALIEGRQPPVPPARKPLSGHLGGFVDLVVPRSRRTKIAVGALDHHLHKRLGARRL
ncbi:MAG: hypothetical protein ACR2RB_18935 [Gammaproteobacteria bacterium]